jgi:hypothetical protein
VERLDVEERLVVDKEPAANEGLNVEDRLDVGVSLVELGSRVVVLAKVERVDEEGEEVLAEDPSGAKKDKTDEELLYDTPQVSEAG